MGSYRGNFCSFKTKHILIIALATIHAVTQSFAGNSNQKSGLFDSNEKMEINESKEINILGDKSFFQNISWKYTVSESERSRMEELLDSWMGRKLDEAARDIKREQAAGRAQGARFVPHLVIDAHLSGLQENNSPEHSESIKISLLNILNALLSENVEESELSVAAGGGSNPKNHRLRDMAFEYALRYNLTANPDDLRKARSILLQFAENMQSWPLRNGRTGSNWVSSEDSSIYKRWDSGGIWGQWYHLDLIDSFPLLKAYDLLTPALSLEERNLIEGNVFNWHLNIINRYPQDFHNCLPYRLEGMARYGVVLKRPDLIHRTVENIRDLHYIGFFPDGMWSEASPAYHLQVVSRIRRIFSILNGYTDPPNYINSQTGSRFDQLDLSDEFSSHHYRMDSAMQKIALPDGYLAALNDTDPKAHSMPVPNKSESELLGNSGFAVLGSGDEDNQQQLFLNFTGTNGHEHRDVLNFHWYALGRRLFDETRYRPILGSSSSRKWQSSTAAHNTVVMDEKSQNGRFDGARSFGPDDAIRGKINYHLRESLGGSSHHGKLMLFDGSNEKVQVVEVDGRNAYKPVAEIYQRTLIKVPLENGQGYIVDIFRVKGGAVHDYMLHGALAEHYKVNTSVKLEKSSQLLHEFIQITDEGKVVAPWNLTFQYQDGAASRSWFLSPEESHLYLGEAPAINRQGDAVFTSIRSGGNDTVFVVVHEAFREKPLIESVQLISDKKNLSALSEVALEIVLRSGEIDTVFSTTGESRKLRVASSDASMFEMKGKLAFVRKSKGKISEAFLWDGTILAHNDDSLIESEFPSVDGVVIGTLRKESGDKNDAIIINKTDNSDDLIGKIVHVNFGDEMIWSYQIKEAVSDGEFTFLHLDQDPGFILQSDGLGKMLFFPGWGTRNPVSFRIPRTFSKNAYSDEK